MQAALSRKKLLHRLKAQLKQPEIKFAVAHYAQFEKGFLVDFFKPARLPFELICTCQIAKRLFPDLPSRAIRAVCGYLGQSIEEEKRSASHVQATAFIWRELIERLESEAGISDLEQLLQFLSAPLPKAVKEKSSAYNLPLERLKLKELPPKPGIYRMISKQGKVLYVGKATRLKDRVKSYFTGRKGKSGKIKELISQIHDFQFQVVATPLEAALLETDEIKRLDPPYNRQLRSRYRELRFYDRDFSAYSLVQSEEFYLGPFVSDALTPFLELADAFRNAAFEESIFFNLAELSVIKDGVALFLETNGLDIENLSPRQLLALGLSFYRAHLNAVRAEARVALVNSAASRIDSLADPSQSLESIQDGEKFLEQENLEQEDLSKDLEDEDLEEEVMDAEQIAEMIEGMLTGCARLYRQSKLLSRLLNSQIYFNENGQDRLIKISQGETLVEAASLKLPPGKVLLEVPDSQLLKGANPWSGLDISDFDRLRVLCTELNRISGIGASLGPFY
ncbi:MAG: UvrABC system protein C [bacterium ADurb.Bin425]|nr:MAG: UvrABC system protein C [bacterium ADurb.Bin425]